MLRKTDTLIQLFSCEDDQPGASQGTLIPESFEKHPKHMFTPQSARRSVVRKGLRLAVSTVAFLAVVTMGTVGYGLVSQTNLATLPAADFVEAYNKNTTKLEYGTPTKPSPNGFFTETRDAFIDEGMTFVEVNIVDRQLRFFQNGVLLQSAEIMRVGEVGSWWETPAGLYKIEQKEAEVFTNIGQVNLPWQLTFQGNFTIHGWPTYADGSVVPDDLVAGGIRLEDKEAIALYQAVEIDTPVLVHTAKNEKRDTFVYEPQVPEIETPHYFIADIDNGTVLAATDLDEAVPVASLTKLMTAVVAAETIDLDGRLRVTAPTFVTSLIPRLSERSSVSLYSLLQLLLVESSNEAAETIAGVNGRAEFIEAMNAKARQLGMMQTNFADPSGLSSENISSLGDLYRLTKYIYDNRSFIFEITANKKLPSAHIGGEFSGLINFNEVKDIDSFVGGKVGETIAAGQTSISLHNLQFQGEDRTVVVIILGSDQRAEDIKTIISYTQSHFNH